MSRFTSRQFLPMYLFLVFGLLLNLSLSSWLNPAQVSAQPSTTKTANSLIATSAATTITACVGSATSTSKVTLAGRVITPSAILRLAPSGVCATGETSVSLAQNGITYLRTVLVSPSASNDPTQNGQALLSAMTTIANASPSITNPYLLKVEPGNYYITTPLTLLPYVDLEGSGEDTTTISSTYSTGSGTLVAASNSEVRSITVVNTGRTAIYVGSSVTNANFTHVTATASTTNYTEGLENNGVINVSDSTFSATGGSTYTFGIRNATNGNLTLTGSTLSANGNGNSAGLYNDGIVTATNTTFKAYDTNIAAGFTNNGSGNLSSNTFLASGDSNSTIIAIFSAGNLITVTNSTLTASGGSVSQGLDNATQIMLDNSTVSASGGSNIDEAILAGGNITVTNSTLTASGGLFSYGLATNGTVMVYNSTITASGGTNSSYGINAASTTNVKISNSQLFGSTTTSRNLTICPFSVNASTFIQLNASCQ